MDPRFLDRRLRRPTELIYLADLTAKVRTRYRRVAEDPNAHPVDRVYARFRIERSLESEAMLRARYQARTAHLPADIAEDEQ